MSSTSSLTELPWEFTATTLQLTNFSTVGQVIYTSDKVPDGFLGIIRDINVIFTTAGGGVRLQKAHRSGGITIFTDALTTTASGLSAIAQGGDKIQVALTSAGVGVVDITMNGVLIKTRLAREIGLSQVPSHLTVEVGI